MKKRTSGSSQIVSVRRLEIQDYGIQVKICKITLSLHVNRNLKVEETRIGIMSVYVVCTTESVCGEGFSPFAY